MRVASIARGLKIKLLQRDEEGVFATSGTANPAPEEASQPGKVRIDRRAGPLRPTAYPQMGFHIIQNSDEDDRRSLRSPTIRPSLQVVRSKLDCAFRKQIFLKLCFNTNLTIMNVNCCHFVHRTWGTADKRAIASAVRWQLGRRRKMPWYPANLADRIGKTPRRVATRQLVLLLLDVDHHRHTFASSRPGHRFNGKS